jgi:hypothetical protein
MSNCSNLLKELSKVTTNNTQKQLLEDLSVYTKQKDLSPKQKALANKLYKELRHKLISSIEVEISRELSELNEYYIDSFMTRWKGSVSHYPLKDIKEAFTNVLNKPFMKTNENFPLILTAYGREFLV